MIVSKQAQQEHEGSTSRLLMTLMSSDIGEAFFKGSIN